MNLGKKYKQLFEGKARSNDSNLLKENTLVDAALKAADKMSYMTSISLEGEDLENDGPLYEPILGVVDYEYELEEEDDYSDDW